MPVIVLFEELAILEKDLTVPKWRGGTMSQGGGRKRGQQSEQMVKQAARQLVGRLPIVSISTAPPKLDRLGIDIFIGLRANGLHVTVPVQVKSSSEKARSYRRKYPTYISLYKVVLMVVEKGKTFEELIEELYGELKKILSSGVTYTAFFDMLTEKMNQGPGKRVRIEIKDLLNEMPLIGSRKKIKFFRPSTATMLW